MKNAMQLRDLSKKMAKEKNITAQSVLQNYMLECLLARISISRFKSNFVLKGGFLISAMLGIQARTTMDMDVTVRKLKTDKQTMKTIFSEICKVKMEDGITFKLTNIEEIRQADIYSGMRIHIDAIFLPIVAKLKIDMTVGDKITPKEINFKYNLLFEKGNIFVRAYNIESILAEKLETILSRSTLNTRMRDFYDIYILLKLKKKEIDMELSNKALAATAKKRGTAENLANYREIILEIRKSEYMRNLWENYSQEYFYANNIKFDLICRNMLNFLSVVLHTQTPPST
jgi:predicted nucleotidyltransferase component of viral defense system